jgi:RNA polymerase sigma-70 factor (ECF subfamily)
MPHPVESDSTDLSLLLRAQRGDPSAWQRFADLYRPLILFWCQRAAVPERDRADISQDAFLAVHNAFASFVKSPTQGTFRGWLFTITSNKIADYYRSQPQRPQVSLSHDVPWSDRLAGLQAEEDSPKAASRLLLLQRILDLVRGDFAETTWTAFQLTVIEELPAPEAASRLGIKADAVRQAKARVLQRIRQEFGELL